MATELVDDEVTPDVVESPEVEDEKPVEAVSPKPSVKAVKAPKVAVPSLPLPHGVTLG